MLKISTNFNWGVTKKSVLSQISSFPKEENVDTTDFLVTPRFGYSFLLI